ncbi:hypothetical protein L9F63_007675, partial [Diploptera punctata]
CRCYEKSKPMQCRDNHLYHSHSDNRGTEIHLHPPNIREARVRTSTGKRNSTQPPSYFEHSINGYQYFVLQLVRQMKRKNHKAPLSSYPKYMENYTGNYGTSIYSIKLFEDGNIHLKVMHRENNPAKIN